jgi:hypothetical protein
MVYVYNTLDPSPKKLFPVKQYLILKMWLKRSRVVDRRLLKKVGIVYGHSYKFTTRVSRQ